MTETLRELNQDIINNLTELRDLTGTIKDLDEELIRNSTQENQLFMKETIDRYKVIVDKICILLECYFKEERDAGLPADFAYRKVYKRLQDAY